MKVLAVFCFVVSSLSCITADDSNTSLFAEYQQRVSKIHELKKLGEGLCAINKIKPAEEALKAEDEFLGTYNSTFNGAFDWLAAVLTAENSTDETKSLFASVFKTNPKLYVVNNTMVTALKELKTAGEIQVCALMLKGEDKVAEKIKGRIQKTIDIAKPIVAAALVEARDGWKKDFTSVAINFIDAHRNSDTITKDVVNFLSKRFPQTAWIAAVIDMKLGNVPYYVCLDYPTPILQISLGERVQLIVAHANPLEPNAAKARLRSALKMLGRVPKSKLVGFTCERKAASIGKQMGYTCGAGKHAMVAAIPLLPKESLTVDVSDRTLLVDKTVRRHLLFFCNVKYRLMVFG